MRFSVHNDDTVGYLNYVQQQPLRVFLGGVEISRVVVADEEARYLVRQRTDEHGKVILNEARDEVLTETLRGDVRVERAGDGSR